MGYSIVQVAETVNSSGNQIATLGASPQVGSVLFGVVQREGNANSATPSITGLVTTLVGGRYRAHATNGTVGWLFYRVVQAGDGTTWNIGNQSAQRGYLLEVRGLDPSDAARAVAAVAGLTDQVTGTLAISITPPAGVGRFAVIGGYITRGSTAGAHTPNAASLITRLTPNTTYSGGVLRSSGSASALVTLGGTLSQTGNVDTPPRWGGNIVAWRELPDPPFESQFRQILAQ